MIKKNTRGSCVDENAYWGQSSEGRILHKLSEIEIEIDFMDMQMTNQDMDHILLGTFLTSCWILPRIFKGVLMENPVP